MEIAETFRRYAERAKQEQLEMEQEEKKLPEGLEEAAKKSASQYYVDGGYSPFPNVETAAHEAGFIAGAEWQKKQDELETADLLSLGWKPTHNSNGELTLVRFSNPRIGFKPASGTLIIGYHEYPHKITSIQQLLSIIDQ